MLQVMNDSGDGASLASLIGRSAELKRVLVDFACGPRTQMRKDRAAFIEFFGGDELVLAPAEAEQPLNAYYRHRQAAALAAHPGRRRPRDVPGVDVPAFDLPAELADADAGT